MRRPVAIAMMIVVAASSVVVVPEAQAAWIVTCKTFNECKATRDLCRMRNGSYGGYVDAWNMKVWGVCVMND